MVDLTPEQRRATAEAVKIARSSDHGRPVLRSVLWFDGRAFVTDSYRIVMLPWLDGLLDQGCLDADDLYAGLKGAGGEWARVEPDGVTRFDPGVQRFDVAPDDLGSWVRGRFPVRMVEGQPPDGPRLFGDAVAAVTAEGFEHSPMFVRADYVLDCVKCRPEFYGGGKGELAVKVVCDGVSPAVLFGLDGVPFAAVMPMRVG